MIRRDNKSGLCQRCVKQTPDFRRKASEAKSKHYASDEARKRTGEAVKRAYYRDPTIKVRKSEAMKAIAATPEWQERNAEQCRDRQLWKTGLAARDEQSFKRQGQTFSRRHGFAAWCPIDKIEFAKSLRRKGFTLDETKAIVQQELEDERNRANGKV